MDHQKSHYICGKDHRQPAPCGGRQHGGRVACEEGERNGERNKTGNEIKYKNVEKSTTQISDADSYYSY